MTTKVRGIHVAASRVESSLTSKADKTFATKSNVCEKDSSRGARYLIGEYLKVVWAKFSPIS